MIFIVNKKKTQFSHFFFPLGNKRYVEKEYHKTQSLTCMQCKDTQPQLALSYAPL